MYTFEIDRIMKQYNFNLSSDVYLHICNTSPQISNIKYSAWDSSFVIKTIDGGNWKFNVYKGEKGNDS